jgi:3-phosphoshikimate 1-carboxyvinyltransferase
MNSSSVTFVCQPGGALHGSWVLPGDKSISHRSIMLCSLAQGVSQVSGFLHGADSLATLVAFQQMGVHIEGPDQQQRVRIEGVGLHGLKKPNAPLDLGNSGTSMRLMSGLLAGQGFDTQLIGDASLSKRPMARVAVPLTKMGAVIQTQNGLPPLHIQGGQKLTAAEFDLSIASAQVKSALLLAGLYAQGKTRVREPGPSRDHTERMLRAMGCEVQSVTLSNGHRQATLTPPTQLKAVDMDIPVDLSSAAFFMVGAAIAAGSDVMLEKVGVNPTRDGIIHLLKRMGAQIELLNLRDCSGEPVADIRIRASQLKAVEIDHDDVVLAIDELPILLIAAACAQGETRVRGAEELRVKESDRLAAMSLGLKQLGIEVTDYPDGLTLVGRGQQAACFNGGVIDSQGDHRIAMSFAMAALRAERPIHIQDCANVATSFPWFDQLAKQAGLLIERNS